MHWTEEQLAELPVRKGFRQRGEAMTRIEIFSDAAFAFAVTMLVVLWSDLPGSYSELLQALKGIPAFAASFAQIMVFWFAHRQWSRRYGLDDTSTTLVTLGMIFIVLVYVYPVRLMMSAFFHFVSGGWFRSTFQVESAAEMSGLVAFFGFGVGLLAGSLSLLFLRSQSAADELGLNERERLETRSDLIVWTIHSAVGFLSGIVAISLPAEIGVYGGFVFFLLPIVIPIVALRYRKRIRAIG